MSLCIQAKGNQEQPEGQCFQKGNYPRQSLSYCVKSQIHF